MRQPMPCRATSTSRRPYSDHGEADRKEPQADGSRFPHEGTVGRCRSARQASILLWRRSREDSSCDHSLREPQDCLWMDEGGQEACQEEDICAQARLITLGCTRSQVRRFRLHQLPVRQRLLASLRGIGVLHRRLRFCSPLRSRRAGFRRSPRSAHSASDQDFSVLHPRVAQVDSLIAMPSEEG